MTSAESRRRTGEKQAMTGELRDQAGRFRQGQSGNPTGRRTDKAAQDARALARASTHEAIETLREIMLDKRASSAARVSAASILLDRGHGKAIQAINANVTSFETLTDDQLLAIASGSAPDALN
jgi:hypothetical protein